MKITEVRIFPTESRDGKLKAFATMTFDDWFVVRNVKVIQGNNGLFVAMPSRKAMDSCPKCRTKNARGSKYCNECGTQLPSPSRESMDEEKKKGAHMDIAHPISQECRVYIQEEILKAHGQETAKKEKEGREYKPARDEGKQGEEKKPVVEEKPVGEEKPREEEKPAAEEKPTEEEKPAEEESVIPKVDESQDIEL